MPYFYENPKNRIKLPTEYDRRVKYTEEDKQEVRDMHKQGMAQRAIARKTGISRRYISFILSPEKSKLCKEQFKERRKDGRYYPSKEEWAKTMREHRKYKYLILKTQNAK